MSKERAAQLVEAGVWLRLSGDSAGARRLFEQALKLDPSNNAARGALAEGASSPSGPPPGEAAAPAENPFERPSRSPSAAENSAVDLDWGLAAGGSDSPVPAALQDDIPKFSSSSILITESGWGAEAKGDDSGIPAQPPVARGPADSEGPGGAGDAKPGAPSKAMTMPFGNAGDAKPGAPSNAMTMPFGNAGNAKPGAPSKAMTMPFGNAGDAKPGAPSKSMTMPFGNANEAKPGAPSKSMTKPFGEASGGTFGLSTITIDGDAPDPEPPKATPPLFAPDEEPTLKPEPPKGPVALPGQVRAASSAAAWEWRGSAAAAHTGDGPLPTPVPSPGLAPFAESAWDHRTNPGIKLTVTPETGGAYDLIEADRPSGVQSPPTVKEQVQALLRGARDLIDLDDHTGAIALIDRAHAVAPEDPEVLQMRQKSEQTLLAMLESKLGDLESKPRVLLKDDEIIWLNLDHRAGFVLAQIDGTVTFDDLFAVSGMSRLDTVRILAQLVEEGVISRR